MKHPKEREPTRVPFFVTISDLNLPYITVVYSASTNFTKNSNVESKEANSIFSLGECTS